MARIEYWLPAPDVTASHTITIAASPERVYEALLATEFGRHPVVAALMAVRTLPALAADPLGTIRKLGRPRRVGTGRVRALLGDAFVLLEEDPPRELVLGLTGRFWTMTGGLVPSDPGSFHEAIPAGHARAAWNFLVEPASRDCATLSTETRVACADLATRQAFRRYWRIVAPGSGLIRQAILGMVRDRAQALRS